MVNVNIILAHRNSVKFMKQQVTLIRKFFEINTGSKMVIYGYIDSEIKRQRDNMQKEWEQLNVIPIQVPEIIEGVTRNKCHPSESFGLASNYVYKNYIEKNKEDIFVCMENDIFPFKKINIEDYVKDYEICGEVRFNARHLPDRMNHFWLGFIIFYF